MRIDLHTHSNRSDGTDSPREVIAQAEAAGLDVVALTDHDTAAGWDEAEEAAAELGIGFLPGIELSTQYDGRSVHLLAYLPDPEHPGLRAEMRRVREGRGDRLPAMVAKLRGLGIDITEEGVVAGAAEGAVIGRPHVADELIRLGVLATREEAFDRFLNPGRPGFSPRYATPVHDACRLVREAGGAPVVAHPWGRNRSLTPAVLAELERAGLVGVEVDHQDHDPDQRAELRGIAGELGLVVTGSSDFHGAGKTDHDLGVNTTSEESYRALLDAIDGAHRERAHRVMGR